MNRDSDSIQLHPVELTDADVLWPIMCEPDVVHYSFEVGQVSRAVFEQWLSNYLSRDDALFYLAKNKSGCVGYVRFDQEAGSIEVDVAVTQKKRRKGYGRELLREGLKRLTSTWPDVRSVLAVVHFQNKASKALFESEGFVQQSMGTREGAMVYRLTKELESC